jgi:TRAP-type uncharacterized transport system fused permease subunit
VQVTITAIIGVTMIGIATEGYLFTVLHWLVRILAFAGALLLITANTTQDVVGFAILIAVLVIQRVRKKRTAQQASPA